MREFLCGLTPQLEHLVYMCIPVACNSSNCKAPSQQEPKLLHPSQWSTTHYKCFYRCKYTIVHFSVA